MIIAVVSHDAGSSELLCAMILTHRTDANWQVFTLPSSPMATICEREGLPFTPIGDATQQLEAVRPDVLLFGTGWQEHCERPYVRHCKTHRIPTVAFLDHWSNYRERFGYPDAGWKENLGDFTALHDPKALDFALSLHLPHPLALPNHYLKRLIQNESTHPAQPKSHLLFLSEPTDAVALRNHHDPLYWGFTQYTALQDILDHFGLFGCDSLAIRLHPSEISWEYEKLLSRYPHIPSQINDTKSIDLTSQLMAAKFLIGFDTMALYIAALLGKPILSYLPSSNREFLLPLPSERQLRSLKNFSPALLEPISIKSDEFGMDFACFLQTVTEGKGTVPYPLRGLIIGAGSIGGLIDTPESEAVASHAHAYSLHPDTMIRAICEPVDANANAFLQRWGKCERYNTLDEIKKEELFDIVSLASPTRCHAHDLRILLERRDVRYLLCEKPLVATSEEFKALSPLLQQSGKKILINLMRRYNPVFIDLARRLQEGEFGQSLGFAGVCTKGLLHNGSHLLGVLSHFLGPLSDLEAIRPIALNNDLCGDFSVTCAHTSGTLSVLEDPGYSLFELTLWCEKGMLKLLAGGSVIEIFAKRPSPIYEGYFELQPIETLDTKLSNSGLDSLCFLLEQPDSLCREILDEHLHLHRIIFQTLEKGLSA